MRLSDAKGSNLKIAMVECTSPDRISTSIHLETSFLSAAAVVDFWPFAIQQFIRDLQTMHHELSGWCQLLGFEGDFELTLVMGKKGELTATAKLVDGRNYTDQAVVVYNLDQSYLPEVINAFEALAR